jgi:hypothetical protein
VVRCFWPDSQEQADVDEGYNRGELRYPSDFTAAEWAFVAPLIPAAKRGGNKRTVDIREIVNGLMYILSTGCQWRAIPVLPRIHHSVLWPVQGKVRYFPGESHFKQPDV